MAAAALPDWKTPQRIRERSERLLPSPDFIERIAEIAKAFSGGTLNKRL